MPHRARAAMPASARIRARPSGLTLQSTPTIISLQRWCAVGYRFGTYLRGIRRERGIGLKRVAPQVGLSYTFLSKLENGHVEPSGQTIERLARFYCIASDEMALAAG